MYRSRARPLEILKNKSGAENEVHDVGKEKIWPSWLIPQTLSSPHVLRFVTNENSWLKRGWKG
jgi:hypothetical protein